MSNQDQKSRLIKKYFPYFLAGNVFVTLIYLKSVFFGFLAAALVYGVGILLVLRHKFKYREIADTSESRENKS